MIVAGCPTADGRRLNSRALIQLKEAGFQIADPAISLLTLAFNECYAYALNAGASHFLLLHADVVPVTPNWPRALVEIAEGRGVVSTVLPIKASGGLTSTALETEDPWTPRRLTLEEVQGRPSTWTEPGLLVNTGLMVVDLRQSFARRVHFATHDRLVNEGGTWVARAQPEDYDFSRQVRSEGGTVWATREIMALHVGTESWPNWIQQGRSICSSPWEA